MAYWTREDLENALGPQTVLAIFDDENTGDVNETALTAIIGRADSDVNSYISINYPKLTLPLGQSPTPDTIKFSSLELGIVYCRDRKPEYWSKAQDGERKDRLKRAFDNLKLYAEAQRYHFDVAAEPKPKNVGAIVYDSGPRLIVDSATGESNSGDF